jgi:anti-sigma regulatory factor (Ser/Thr protein kinase)
MKDKAVVLRRSIPAILSSIDRLCCELRQGLLAELPAGERFALELLLREALTNAICHGAAQACEVWCEIERLDDGIAMRVCDPGKGFDWRKCMQAAAAPLAESGRGIAILLRYASVVRFNESGNWVEVVRRFDKGEQNAKL